jgi:hypothetical protein
LYGDVLINKGIFMSEKIIKLDDINYAIYKIGNWKNKYKINQIGLSNEIPLTKTTYEHVISSMNEIRNSEFEINGNKVNGFIAIGYSTSKNIQEMPMDKLIELEKEEFENIKNELDNLEFLDPKGAIDLDNEDYLIYKLEKECHVTKSKPANQFTLDYHINEIKRIEDSLN